MEKKKSIGKDILIRVRWLYLFFLFAAVVIVGRILWVQWGPEGEDLREKAEQVTFSQFEVPASRGDILARDGRILSTTIPEYEIRMDFSVLNMKKDSFDIVAPMLANDLSTFFGNMSDDEYNTLLYRCFAAKEKNRYTRISPRRISYLEEKQVAQFPIFREGRYKGGYIARQSNRRFMPMDSLARSTIGTIRQDSIISGGLEASYDSILRGAPGLTMKQKISGSFWIPVPDEGNREPVDGYDIVTTINADIQDVAETALRKQMTESNAEWGTVILMKVSTGEILALCNLSKQGAGRYGEIYNHATRTPVEPGSTFKLATLLALLEDGGMSIDNTVDCRPDPGRGLTARIGIKDVRDDHRCDIQSLQKTFEQSSNIGFARSTYNIYKDKPERFVEFLTDSLGFGRKTGIDIPGERTPDVKHPSNKKRWDKTSLQMMSYGYALEVTPLQTLNLYNTVANDGVMMRPMLVKEIRRYGKTIKTFEPDTIRKAIASPGAIRAAQQCLAGVVDAGTGRVLKSASYRAAAKTGTAQQVVRGGGYRAADGGLDIMASFTGYLPLENPEYSCIVAIKAHEPPGRRFYGASLAGPVFRTIADRIYASTIELHDKTYGPERFAVDIGEIKGGLTETVNDVVKKFSLPYTIPDEGERWWTASETHDINPPLREMPEDGSEYPNVVTGAQAPNVKGMGLRDAVYILEQTGFKVTFEGKGAVASQSIAGGQYAPEDSTVHLILKN